MERGLSIKEATRRVDADSPRGDLEDFFWHNDIVMFQEFGSWDAPLPKDPTPRSVLQRGSVRTP
jgi:hypothetical protein